jgi:hypothetical protein
MATEKNKSLRHGPSSRPDSSYGGRTPTARYRLYRRRSIQRRETVREFHREPPGDMPNSHAEHRPRKEKISDFLK